MIIRPRAKMSIEHANTVDVISTDPETGEVVLIITDHLQWGSNEHLFLLQEKLNSYLAFIEGGELLGAYPSAKGCPVRIDVVCRYRADPEAEYFLHRAREVIQEAGFGFRYEVFAQT